MPIVIVTLSIDLQQSRQIHSVVSSHLSLSLLEVVRAISYKVMLNKVLVLDQFCEPTPAHKGDNFMESHERRRYYVEILYNTSVFRLCPGRQFIS